MDPDTEKRLAALIMEEAARLRLQADQDGVHVYLGKPQARGRPNPQFIQATVRGIQQANRAAEVNDMWRRRAKELEVEHGNRNQRHSHRVALLNEVAEKEEPKISERILDEYYSKRRMCSDERDKPSSSHDTNCSFKDGRHRRHKNSSPRLHVSSAVDHHSESLSEHSHEVLDDLRDEGLKDDEVEQFLHSRVKRGRGAIGSRMDEPGPYLLPQHGKQLLPDIRLKEDWEERVVGPIAGPLLEKSNDLSLDSGQLWESKAHKKRKHKFVEDIADRVEGNSRSKDRLSKKEKKKHRNAEKKKKRKRRKGKDDRHSDDTP